MFIYLVTFGQFPVDDRPTRWQLHIDRAGHFLMGRNFDTSPRQSDNEFGARYGLPNLSVILQQIGNLGDFPAEPIFFCEL